MNILVKGLLLSWFARSTFGLQQNAEGCQQIFKDAISSKELTSTIFSDLAACNLYINSPLNGNLTPLHLAAKKGAIQLIAPLLESGADIDALDANHLTPLVHAAVSGHVAAVNTLLAKGANGSISSKFDGLYTDYLRMNQPFRPEEPALDPVLSSSHPFSTHLHDKVTTASECLPKNVKAVNEMVAKPAQLSSLLETTSSDYDMVLSIAPSLFPQKLHDYFLDRYKEFKANPPPLSIASIKTTEKGISLPANIDMCGVVAAGPIPKGTIIAEYTGELKTLSIFADTTYHLNDFPPTDGLKFRSAASMMNSAFPNSHLIHLAQGKLFNDGLDGLPFRKLIVAINDIAEGEEIVWNYGGYYESGQHVELKDAALKRFLETVSWKELIEALKKHDLTTISIEEALHALDQVTKLTYLLESENALKYAIKYGYLNKRHLKLFETAIEAKQLGSYCQGAALRLIRAASPLLNKKNEL